MGGAGAALLLGVVVGVLIRLADTAPLVGRWMVFQVSAVEVGKGFRGTQAQQVSTARIPGAHTSNKQRTRYQVTASGLLACWFLTRHSRKCKMVLIKKQNF